MTRRWGWLLSFVQRVKRWVKQWDWLLSIGFTLILVVLSSPGNRIFDALTIMTIISMLISIFLTVNKTVNKVVEDAKHGIQKVAKDVAVALDVYGLAAALRGRDFFGPVFQADPAREVSILVELRDGSDPKGFSYRLDYRIEIEEPLGSPLLVELAALPQCYVDGTRYSYYRYQAAGVSHLTFDFEPVVSAAPGSSVDDVACGAAKQFLNQVQVFCRRHDEEWSKLETSIRANGLQVKGAHLDSPRDFPLAFAEIPASMSQIRVRTDFMSYPLAGPILRMDPPVRAKKLTIGWSNACDKLDVVGVTCAGEGKNILRTPLRDPHPLIHELPGARGGYTWTAQGQWMITPGDLVHLWFRPK